MSSSSEPELQNINNIYSSEGKNKNAWELFFKDINNDNYKEKIVMLLEKTMKENPTNELTVDIIDFIMDFGNPNIINLIAQKQFQSTFINLLKSDTNAGIENQKKVIYLTQKWSKKFNENQNLSIFLENYKLLKNSGIVFPPESFIIITYSKFVNKNDIINFNSNKNQKETNNDNDFSIFSQNNNEFDQNSENKRDNNINNNNYNNNNFNNNEYTFKSSNNFNNNNYNNKMQNNKADYDHYKDEPNNYYNQNINNNNDTNNYNYNYNQNNQSNHNFSNNYNQETIKNPFENNSFENNNHNYQKNHIQNDGFPMGNNDGAIFYTIGQRHGLNVGGGLPYYVVKKDLEKNIVYVSKNLNEKNLWTSEIELEDLLIRGELPKSGEIEIRIRHRAPLIPAKFDEGKVILKEKIKRPASGQSIVFYSGDTCLGGGIVK